MKRNETLRVLSTDRQTQDDLINETLTDPPRQTRFCHLSVYVYLPHFFYLSPFL